MQIAFFSAEYAEGGTEGADRIGFHLDGGGACAIRGAGGKLCYNRGGSARRDSLCAGPPGKRPLTG